MPPHPSFRELLEGLINKEPEAAEEMVRVYGGAIIREVQLQLLTRSYLRRQYDSGDIVQSVLMRFFLRIDLGELDLKEPEHLLALLREMARNRIHDKERLCLAAKRDVRRERHGDDALAAAGPAVAETPSHVLSYEELLRMAEERLSPEERSLARARRDGQSWDAIAAERGVSAEALRVRLARARRRVLHDLGLDAQE